MVISKAFFVKYLSDDYCFFCHRRKQKYRIRHSDRAFNTRQIEISTVPVSIAKGCRFAYRSWFLFIESLQQHDNGTDSHFNRRRMSYKHMSFNQYFRKKSN